MVEGMARARMDQIPYNYDRRFPVLPILMHGDAAFAGQGVVAETLNLALIKGYRVGGTIHVIVNNQLGFTTPPESARSSEYCTDIAKAVQAPIFHVNGDDPEACVRVARLAYAYRQRFHKDVVIDMVCYRRHGHNEGDDPSYTQPLMYRKIEELAQRPQALRRDARPPGRHHHGRGRVRPRRLPLPTPGVRWTRPGRPLPARSIRRFPTHRSSGCSPTWRPASTAETLDEIYATLASVPEGFTVHPKLAKQFQARDALYADGQVDWSLAESMAWGSLLKENTSVRLAGQDTRRGTFSQRHSTLFDYNTGTEYVPLNALSSPPETMLWIYDSLLSEYAALGFEYGYSVVSPETLVMWEAQFGDFSNGAQIIIDQFIVVGRGQVAGRPTAS